MCPCRHLRACVVGHQSISSGLGLQVWFQFQSSPIVSFHGNNLQSQLNNDIVKIVTSRKLWMLPTPDELDHHPEADDCVVSLGAFLAAPMICSFTAEQRVFFLIPHDASMRLGSHTNKPPPPSISLGCDGEPRTSRPLVGSQQQM